MLIKIDKDTIKEVHETIINLKPLRKRMIEINEEIKSWEEQPDEMMMPNFDKVRNIESLESEKEEINKKLAVE